MTPRFSYSLLCLAVFSACAHKPTPASKAGAALDAATTALVGCDETTGWDDFAGLQPAAPGADELVILDLGVPAQPKVKARLPLRNSVYGPPTNLVLSRTGSLALIASSIRMTMDAGKWSNVPDNELHVIDLRPAAAHMVTQVIVGKQPSGVDIAPDGALALVANRKSRSVSVIDLRLVPPQVTAEVGVDAEAADVKFTPDGKRALVSNYDAQSITLLNVSGRAVTVAGRVEVGPFPYSVAIAPNGRFAFVGNMGDKTGSDGVPDAVSVIDLQAQPRVSQAVIVGDGPEGLAISPDGSHVAVVLINGSNSPPNAPYAHKTGQVRLLSISATGQVTAHTPIEVGTMAEGARFAADGSHVIAGNFRDRDLTVLSVKGDELQLVGRVPLGCRPASLK
ncbi:MAG: YncE family protein [Deltaproteobacteria bacterium]|nr:YncE family protein [Deltaproteobacteria bacterium]